MALIIKWISKMTYTFIEIFSTQLIIMFTGSLKHLEDKIKTNN